MQVAMHETSTTKGTRLLLSVSSDVARCQCTPAFAAVERSNISDNNMSIQVKMAESKGRKHFEWGPSDLIRSDLV